MRFQGFIALTVVAFAAVGCDRKPTDEVKKPVDTVASAKPSGSALVVAVNAPRCENGTLVAPPATAGSADAGPAASVDAADPDAGFGIGLSGVGGNGLDGLFGAYGGGDGGIGLGAGGGGSTSFVPKHSGPLVKLKGQTLAVEGFATNAVEEEVCKAYPAFMKCFEDATTTKKDLDGTIGLLLRVDEEGKVTSRVEGGSLDDMHLVLCVSAEGSKLLFGKPSSKNASVRYAFSAHRPAKTPKMTIKETGTSVAGRLPPEVIKRIMRSRVGALRACYERALEADPSLKGTLVVDFVIDDKGAVESAKIDSGTLTDAAVRACIVSQVKRLAFPAPEGGKVKVTYPIELASEGNP